MIETSGIGNPVKNEPLALETRRTLANELYASVRERFDDPSKRQGWVENRYEPGMDSNSHPYEFTRKDDKGQTEKFSVSYSRDVSSPSKRIEITRHLYDPANKLISTEARRVISEYNNIFIASGGYDSTSTDAQEGFKWRDSDSTTTASEVKTTISNLP